jgi:hypothetical protein
MRSPTGNWPRHDSGTPDSLVAEKTRTAVGLISCDHQFYSRTMTAAGASVQSCRRQRSCVEGRGGNEMLSVHGIPILLQLVVPLALLGWQAFGRDRTVAGWLVKNAIVTLYLAAVATAGLWVLVPWQTPAVLLLIVVAIALFQLRSVRRLPWRTHHPSWNSSAVRAAIGATAIFVLAASIDGRRIPSAPVVDLAFPLRHGTYYVAAGGSTELLNPHLRTLTADRFRAYRGQSYGVDLIKLRRPGTRASGLLPRDPVRYAIYGDTVYAPCSGAVVRSEDGFEDMRPPQPDRAHMAGNYVLLNCGGVHVLLGHLRPGSVRVLVGEPVAAGAAIGQVGNSGNTNEPHLHLHAQRPATAGHEPLSGDPLPVRFDGRFLVRNDRVRSQVR